jgi:hypothetical protein
MGHGVNRAPEPFSAPKYGNISHFDELHLASVDPWGVHTRWYEQRKRELLLAALPRRHYRHGFEPGCSVGGNSRALAARCDRLTVSDASLVALDQARINLADLPSVRLENWRFPEQWPATPCDLVVISEFGYYLDEAAVGRFLELAPDKLAEGGNLLMCHWRKPIPDAFFDGDSLHAMAHGSFGQRLQHVGGWCDADVRIDVWQRGGNPSVHQAENAG